MCASMQVLELVMEVLKLYKQDTDDARYVIVYVHGSKCINCLGGKHEWANGITSVLFLSHAHTLKILKFIQSLFKF